MQGFDFDLKFLDIFVHTQISQGKKSYDTSRRQIIGDFHIEGASLNYKAYAAPGMTRVNTTLPQSNPLFQQEESKGNADDSFQVKS